MHLLAALAKVAAVLMLLVSAAPARAAELPVLVQSSSGPVPIAVFWDEASGSFTVGIASGGGYYQMIDDAYRMNITGRFTPSRWETTMWANGSIGGFNVQPTVVAPPGSGHWGSTGSLGVTMNGVYFGGAFETDTGGYHSAYAVAYFDTPNLIEKGAAVDYLMAFGAEFARPCHAVVACLAWWTAGQAWMSGFDPAKPILTLRPVSTQTAPVLVIRAVNDQLIWSVTPRASSQGGAGVNVNGPTYFPEIAPGPACIDVAHRLVRCP